jgi:carboxyl-terminal processing protease
MRSDSGPRLGVVLTADLLDLRELLLANRAQLERQLGARLDFEAGGDRRWLLRLGAPVPRLVLDRSRGEPITEAPDRDGLYEALSLLWSLHRLPSGIHEVRDCQTALEAVALVEQAVAETWPSFELHGIDWPALSARWRPRALGADDPIPEIQAWLAELRDAHTSVRPHPPFGRLPYEAELVGEEVIVLEVPEGTAGYAAGARAGERLSIPDAAEIVRTTAAPPALARARRRTPVSAGSGGGAGDAADDAGTRWSEPYRIAPWPTVITWSVRESGEGYLRIRAFLPESEVILERALAELRGRRLVIDLRGNAGGSSLMASRLRDRLQRGGTAGFIRYRDPRGGLFDREPIGAKAALDPWDHDVAFLVDELTYSASEDLLLGLAGQPNVRILGSRTGGGSGRARALRLLPGWRLHVTTCHTFTNAGRCIEGTGVPVDGPCPPDLEWGRSLP